MLHDLYYDFGQNGDYSSQTETTQNYRRARRAINYANSIHDTFKEISTVVTGRIGNSLNLTKSFKDAGLIEVIQLQRPASYDEEIKSIQVFFNILDARIFEASAIATQVNNDLAADNWNLHGLAGVLDGIKTNKKVFNMSPTSWSWIIPSFEELVRQCNNYVSWHSEGTDPGYHTRPRRAITEACDEQRMEAMLAEPHSSNTTVAVLVRRAHSIVKSINCL
ncbi:uncharacterized protein LOC108594894 [Drosophila busckii]|uniref:uncharacterized protein LOC108594894 n=1 Tax=Drosophila busckii TaxID=30019 RepID=UPI00083F0C94|nr:uncharacterized protein LOC108594894 [Drosophila busckii]